MSGASSGSAGERVGNVGQGLVKGTLTFGGGLLKGVTGIVADPVAGAKQGGVLGFMTGVGKGLVGVPGQIIGGALSAASQVTEGLDASVNKVSVVVLVAWGWFDRPCM
jgi:vacuolar protein sorting-associated protein 13A/C